MNEDDAAKEQQVDQEEQERVDYLADVLRVWDCDEAQWLGAAPIVLRFENEDVLVGSSSAHPAALPLVEASSEDACLCWRRDAALSFLVGLKLSARTARECIAGLLRMHAAEARFLELCDRELGAAR